MLQYTEFIRDNYIPDGYKDINVLKMGILDYISKIGIINVKETEGPIASIHFLDTVISENKGEDNPWTQPTNMPFADSPRAQTTDIKTMSLVTKTKTVELSDVVVPLPNDLDPSNVIRTHILKRILGGISYLALKHKQEVESHSIVGLDIEINDTSDTSVRKIISKILACSNFVATNGRRGPANFIIASQDILNFINFQRSDEYIYEPEYSLMGLKMLACNDLGNTVLIGRGPGTKTKENQGEPGMFLLTKEDLLPFEYKFDKTETDITDAKIKYAISDVGDRAYCNYIQFDVKFTEK